MSFVQEVLLLSGIRFLKVLPIIIIGLFVGKIVELYLPRSFVKKYINKPWSLFVIGAAAMTTPGPLYASLPLLYALRKKGAHYGIIVTYITSDLMVGPLRLFLEVNYFGVWYLITRLFLTYAISIALGFCFWLAEHKGWLKR